MLLISWVADIINKALIYTPDKAVILSLPVEFHAGMRCIRTSSQMIVLNYSTVA
jgi:hypothetical protein